METPKTDFPPVRACIFDMDGLLLNSEDLYTIVTNTILHKYGRPSLPWSIKAQLQGRPGPEASRIFHSWAQLPISLEQYHQENAALQRELFTTTAPLPGVEKLLKNLKGPSAMPRVHMSLATSSHRTNFLIKTNHLSNLFSVFPESQVVVGDDQRIKPGRGKPAPDIYRLALETINEQIRIRRETESIHEDEIAEHECLVFEDSIPGVEAGRRAGMRVIWCPHPELLAEYEGREKEVLAGLTGEHKEEDVVENAEGAVGGDANTKAKADGQPGEIDDGWAELLYSLEHFSYSKYGIQVPQGHL